MKIIYLSLSLFISILFWLTCSVSFAQQDPGSRTYETSPIQVLNAVKWNANKHKSEEVQKTELDVVNSIDCDEIAVGTNFTITRTLCSIKKHSQSYLEYVIYVWLTAATIFLIRNGFQLVTAPDRWKQIWIFKKNLKYIIIWVILLISFYYILDIFVTTVNLIAE